MGPKKKNPPTSYGEHYFMQNCHIPTLGDGEYGHFNRRHLRRDDSGRVSHADQEMTGHQERDLGAGMVFGVPETVLYTLFLKDTLKEPL